MKNNVPFFRGVLGGGPPPKKSGVTQKNRYIAPDPTKKWEIDLAHKNWIIRHYIWCFPRLSFFQTQKPRKHAEITWFTITFYPALFFRGVFPKKITKILISRARIIIFWNGFQQNVLWILFYRLEQKSNKNHHPSSIYVVFSRKNNPVAASPCLALWHYY